MKSGGLGTTRSRRGRTTFNSSARAAMISCAAAADYIMDGGDGDDKLMARPETIPVSVGPMTTGPMATAASTYSLAKASAPSTGAPSMPVTLLNIVMRSTSSPRLELSLNGLILQATLNASTDYGTAAIRRRKHRRALRRPGEHSTSFTAAISSTRAKPMSSRRTRTSSTVALVNDTIFGGTAAMGLGMVIAVLESPFVAASSSISTKNGLRDDEEIGFGGVMVTSIATTALTIGDTETESDGTVPSLASIPPSLRFRVRRRHELHHAVRGGAADVEAASNDNDAYPSAPPPGRVVGDILDFTLDL